ncbi:hypothetical protein GQ54DRAFT_307955 [Martensiomyces pterosporus]|nr:hypothetical protein GQ54DRAFT_307955 [Martensiomyces pterosporus]
MTSDDNSTHSKANNDNTANDAQMRSSTSDGSSIGGSTTGDIHLTILMVSGVRTSLSFKTEDTVLSVKEQLFQNWPKDFDTRPAAPANLRIVYFGHFLDDNDTLAESKLQPGNTTVHLTIKATSTPEKTAKKDVDKAPKCTCVIL